MAKNQIGLDESSLLERLPHMTEVRLFDELESTNDYGKQVINSISFPALIYSRNQTRGRGRGGNSWISNQGSLTFSFLIDVSGQAESSSGLRDRFSLGWAISVALALNELAGENGSFQIKWPNDVMANGKKVAGILIESVASFPERYVVGIGINVLDSPDNVGDPASGSFDAISVLEATGKEFTHLEILESIWRVFETIKAANIDFWFRTYELLDFLKGRKLVVRQGVAEYQGKYLGLGPSTELRLETDDEIVSLHSGSIVQVD